MQYAILPSARPMPLLGLGTFDLRGEEGAHSIATAIGHGYRHLDTALSYDNHDAIRAGIAQAGIPRDALFVTSKIPREQLAYDDVLRACERSLSELDLSYLDLFLIHWPNNEIPLCDTLRAFAYLRESGQIRNAGVSNFTTWRLREALHYDLLPIAANQVEFHPYLNQHALRLFCAENDIALVGYSPLAQGAVLDDPVLSNIAAACGKHTAQVALRWLVEKEIGAIPRSHSAQRQAANRSLFDWSLSVEEMEEIDAIEQTLRVINYWPGEFEKGE